MTSEIVPLVLGSIVLIVRRRQVTGTLARFRGVPAAR